MDEKIKNILKHIEGRGMSGGSNFLSYKCRYYDYVNSRNEKEEIVDIIKKQIPRQTYIFPPWNALFRCKMIYILASIGVSGTESLIEKWRDNWIIKRNKSLLGLLDSATERMNNERAMLKLLRNKAKLDKGDGHSFMKEAGGLFHNEYDFIPVIFVVDILNKIMRDYNYDYDLRSKAAWLLADYGDREPLWNIVYGIDELLNEKGLQASEYKTRVEEALQMLSDIPHKPVFKNIIEKQRTEESLEKVIELLQGPFRHNSNYKKGIVKALRKSLDDLSREPSQHAEYRNRVEEALKMFEEKEGQ